MENGIKIKFSEDFRKILESILNKGQSNISKRLLELEQSEELFDISYIDRTDENDTITFIPYRKALGYIEKGDEEKCWKSARNNLKIGRFLIKIFGTKFSQQSIEKFVNKYKSVIKREKINENFELVDGEDIRYWYHRNNYEEIEGALGNSCMSYPECQRFLDLYVKNPQSVKLLILKNDNGKKIYGRALVWNLTEPENTIFMDRIYTVNDEDIEIFKDYALKNNWIFKTVQGYGADEFIMKDKSKNKKLDIQVELQDVDFDRYPYMDTLIYFYRETRILSNLPDLDEEKITLQDTEGYYNEYDGEEEYVEDEYNGGQILMQEAMWCDYGNGYTTRDDAVYCKMTHKYGFPNLVKYSKYTDAWFSKDDLVWSEMLDSWIWKKYAVKAWLNKEKTKKDWGHRLNKNKIRQVGDDYYVIELLEKDLETEEYRLKTINEKIIFNKDIKKYLISLLNVKNFNIDEYTDKEIDLILFFIDTYNYENQYDKIINNIINQTIIKCPFKLKKYIKYLTPDQKEKYKEFIILGKDFDFD